MLSVVNTKLGEARGGVPRIWLEGTKLSATGFEPGQPLYVSCDKQNKRVLVKNSCDGNDISKVSVSKRTKQDRVVPLIEIKSEDFRDLFGEVGVLLRVVIKGHGVFTIEQHGLNCRIAEREARLRDKISNGEQIAVGSLFSGGGVLDHAVHEGLLRGGIKSFNSFVVEREYSYLDAMVRNSPHLFNANSILIESSIEHVEFKKPPQVDLVIAGIPCTGASRAGKAKNQLEFAEDHNEAGACFFYLLNFVSQTNPAIVVIENVPDYMTSASYSVIKSVLTTLGYKLADTVLNGVRFGALENRDRMCLVAISKGLESFDFASLVPVAEKPAQLRDVLEDVPEDDSSWKLYDYLAEKEIRDKSAGKGFKRALVTGSEGSVPTLRRLYHKGGSCDTFLLHPDGKRSRLFTASEHARIKGIPQIIIAGLSETIAHEVLGQSVIYPVFLALGVALAAHIEVACKSNYSNAA